MKLVFLYKYMSLTVDKTTDTSTDHTTYIY